MTEQRTVWQEPQFPSIRLRPGPEGRICASPVDGAEPVEAEDAVVIDVEPTVGTLVGATVGAAVGAEVGTTVGALVGATVGAAVGAEVDTTVGALVGATVGAVVGGTLVGTAVGTAVGEDGTEQAVISISIAKTTSTIKRNGIRCINHIS